MSDRRLSRVRLLLASIVCGALTLAGPVPVHAQNAMGAASDGWESLFNGKDLSQWRGYRMDHAPSAWKVEDGVIALDPQPGDEAADLMTRAQYGDFDLEYDWKISEGGNSGLIYRIAETEESSWMTGPEMQVIDNEGHPDGKIANHRAGALYDIVTPPEGIANPVGQWNHARVRVEGNHIEQWLNGHKTADIEIGGAAWKAAMVNSKFRTMPSFATVARGYIALQDHGGDKVWYRNLRIRPLDEGR